MAFALLNLLTSSGDPSRDAHSLWEGQIPHAHRKGSWRRNSQKGRAWQWGASQGLWGSSTPTSALIHCVLTGRNQKVQRRHPRVTPPQALGTASQRCQEETARGRRAPRWQCQTPRLNAHEATAAALGPWFRLGDGRERNGERQGWHLG